MSYKVMIVTGEASGDLHGAKVAAALREMQPDICLYGVGGQAMTSAGVNIICDIKELNVMGIVEVAKKYPHIKRIFDKLVNVLRSDPPDVLVTIDYADFNMRLARVAKDLGIKVVYYIAPSVWAWRRGRAKTIAKSVERVASIFPFEAEVYQAEGAKVTFVGHPLLDIVQPSMKRHEAMRYFAVDAACPVITLMPGSRKQEIEALLPEMLQALTLLRSQHTNVQCFLPLAATISPKLAEDICSKYNVDVRITRENTYDLMGISTFIIASSGTATLEAALMGTPTIILYKLSLFAWLVAKLLVKISYIGLPNLVAGRQIVPELLQGDVTAVKIAKIARSWLEQPEKLALIRSDLQAMKTKLGEYGAVRRVAEIVQEIAAQ